jgi:GTP-binding protein Era
MDMQAVDASEHMAMTRAGFAALVGRPNAGKSTLLNALLGEKLSIVTPRAQTTREAVRGILTTPTTQIVFVDTPGLVEPAYLLHRSMLFAALTEVEGADAILLLLDATRPGEAPPAVVTQGLRARADRLIVAINKIDAGSSDAIRTLTSWSLRELGMAPLLVSASAAQGLDVLRARLEAAMPEGPFLHPEGDLATQPVRFFVEELIRETIFEEYEQEIPYAAAVRIEEYHEDRDPVYIRAVIYVERVSQKGILIGKGGSMIRRLGERSREKIEAFVGQHVYLDLWVKTLPGWRRKAGALKYLGFPLPPDPPTDN